MNNSFIKALIFITILFFLLPLTGITQTRTKITIEKADELSGSKNVGTSAKKLRGNVVFRHETTLLFCDSAFLYDATNSLDAFGNIHIKDGDTLDIWGDSLKYDGNTKIARIFNNVRMTDQQMTLTTNYLTYDMDKDLGTYSNGGKIVDQSNTLTSKLGYYYSESKRFFFRKDVVLVNPEYTMYSDTLLYNTNTEIAYFYGPTRIESKENFIYCENGWYNTKTDISQFNKKAFLKNNEQTITGDSLYYNRNTGFGKALGNIVITDTVEDFIIFGGIANYHEQLGYSTITDSAQAIFIEKQDSLFLHADTLKVLFDSAREGKNLLAYHYARFYRSDMQGCSDSLSYDFHDSTIFLYYSPILWTEKDQLTADTMMIKIVDNEVKTLHCIRNCFIIERDSTDTYNQIKGKNMVAWFENREMRKVDIKGNAETMYFVRDELKNLIGVNKAVSSDLGIYIEDRKIKGIVFISEPVATLYPPTTLAPKELLLKDFIWHEKKKPVDRWDIFRKE